MRVHTNLNNIARTVLFFTVIITASLTPAHANLLTNGSFETPVISPPYLDIGVGAEPAGFGWTVTVNNVDINAQGQFGWTAPEFNGVQSLDLVGFGSTGGIAQTFATIAGQHYSLFFAYGNNPDRAVPLPALATVTVTSGINTLLSESISHSTSTTSNLNWSVFDMQFTATGTSAVLAFNETQGGANGGIFLDAVAIAPVPEPSTLASFALGGLCLMLVRQRSKYGKAGRQNRLSVPGAGLI